MQLEKTPKQRGERKISRKQLQANNKNEKKGETMTSQQYNMKATPKERKLPKKKKSLSVSDGGGEKTEYLNGAPALKRF
jgi:hypothetical protein